MPQTNSRKKNLVVGAGFSGAIIAQKLAEILDDDVLIIDKNPYLGGISSDYTDKNGITVHKFGSHIFHTNYDYIWKYLNRFSKFETFFHTQYMTMEGMTIPSRFNLNTISELFPPTLAKRIEKKLINKYGYGTSIPILDFKTKPFIWDNDLDFLANYIYQKCFIPYNEKQWNTRVSNNSSKAAEKINIHINKDNRQFQDKYQGVPKEGYTKLVENILNHKNIKIILSTDFKNIDINGFDRVFYTGPIDEFFNYKYGTLEYRSAKFEFEEINQKYYQKSGVTTYPSNYDFIKIHEYKHYTNIKSPTTIIAKEYITDFALNKNERFYPVLNEKSLKMHKCYKNEAKKLDNVYFLGRLGDFKNYDMDKAIKRSIEVFDAIRFKNSIIRDSISSDAYSIIS